MKVLSIVGARPNFMKIAPIYHELARQGIEHFLVHTGQHYDEKMSKLFFEELEIPKPDVNLEVGSGTQAEQTAEIMKRLEPVLISQRPDLMVVVGDVTSTMAATITAAKLMIPVAHVESGLRSFDRTMPEEINRVITDAVVDYHFTTEESANRNLVREGIPPEKIFFVGNTMIDSLLKHVDKATHSSILDNIGLSRLNYGVVTLHRPSNVDDQKNMTTIIEALAEIASELPLIFPVHPRTRNRLKEYGLAGFAGESVGRKISGGLILTDPLGYLDFLKLLKDARLVFTDSGGIQEETTVLGVPCLTLRENTERPVTVCSGTNMLVGMNGPRIVGEGRKRINEGGPPHVIPPLWDGRAAERIVEKIVFLMEKKTHAEPDIVAIDHA